MSRLALTFFATAAVCALGGMTGGMLMGITNNMTLAPAHAHLNLLGWTTLALMGGFYALARDRAPVQLGWINYILSAAGVVIFVPSLATLLLTTGRTNLGVAVGSISALAGMGTFLAAVVVVWRGRATEV